MDARYCDLKGRWFWVCGASSGIGLAVAQELARNGAKLILMARSVDKLEGEIAPALRALGAPELRIAALDLTAKTTPSAAAALTEGLPLHGILLNGGGPHGAKAADLAWDDFELAHRMLFQGPASLLNALLPRLVQPGGSVLAITSTTVIEPNADLPLSGAYRRALVSLLKSLSDDLGPQGLRFNNVAPGFTRTERLSDLQRFVAQKRSGDASEDALSQVERGWAQLAALKRVAEPPEIGRLCAFLLSEASSFVTGQTIVADGGQTRSI